MILRYRSHLLWEAGNSIEFCGQFFLGVGRLEDLRCTPFFFRATSGGFQIREFPSNLCHHEILWGKSRSNYLRSCSLLKDHRFPNQNEKQSPFPVQTRHIPLNWLSYGRNDATPQGYMVVFAFGWLRTNLLHCSKPNRIPHVKSIVMHDVNMIHQRRKRGVNA